MSEKPIGALWSNTTKTGKPYFSGKINDVKVIIFLNEYKQEDTDPDYKVFESKPRGVRDEPSRTQTDYSAEAKQSKVPW